MKTRKQARNLGIELVAAMEEVLAHTRGKLDLPCRKYPNETAENVAKIRKKIGMTQIVFADSFGLNVSTLRDWEQGRRKPDRTAQILLNIISHHPKIVMETLSL